VNPAREPYHERRDPLACAGRKPLSRASLPENARSMVPGWFLLPNSSSALGGRRYGEPQ